MARVSISIDDLRQQIDAELDEYLTVKRAAIPDALPLIEEIERLFQLGGKRLRPAFCYWGFRAGGGDHAVPILRASSALELLHTFALVHDDIMDETRVRRGGPTTHALHGRNFALLVGDLALVLADAALMGSGFPPDAIGRAFSVYSRMRQEVIAGQYLDLALSQSEQVDEVAARRVALLKSGLYSVVEPLTIGATLANASNELIERMREAALPVGEAFQLRDDLLGTFGDPDELGKPTDSDIKEGKRHLLYVKTIASLEDPDRDFFRSRWGADDLTDDEIDQLRDLIESSGARKEIEIAIEGLCDGARNSVDELSIGDEPRNALRELITLATQRDV